MHETMLHTKYHESDTKCVNKLSRSKLNDDTICFIYTFWFDKFSLSLFAFIRYNAKLFNTYDFDEFSNAINLYTLGLT